MIIALFSGGLFLSSCGEKSSDAEVKENTDEGTDEEEDGEDVGDEEELGADWKTFTNEDGGFTVKMPEIPKEEVSDQATDAGVIKMHMFIHPVGEEELYMVGYNDFPETLMSSLSDDDKKNMLQGGKQGAMRALSGYGDETIVDEETSYKYYDKYEALKFRAHNGEHYCYVKCFIKENRLYQVWKVKTGDYTAAEKADVFFSSFKLLDEEETPEG